MVSPHNASADAVLDHLLNWARDTHLKLKTGSIFVFGSLVNKAGKQFNSRRSDIDLVVMVPSTIPDAKGRVIWLQALFEEKQRLEVNLLTLLRRSEAGRPISSIVPMTSIEVANNIHKSGASGFFRDNEFLNLINEQKTRGIPVRSKTLLPDAAKDAIRWTQSVRNQYLGVSPNGETTLADWDGADPLPKEIMRFSALVRSTLATTVQAGENTDLQIGLDYLYAHLLRKRNVSDVYANLCDLVSVRRGARGQSSPISIRQYLSLSEVLFDIAQGKVMRGRNKRAAVSRSRVVRPVQPTEEPVQINPYKLFYHRATMGLSFADLANLTGVEGRLLRRMETVKGPPLSARQFPVADRKTIETLEEALSCPGRLTAGQKDDFLSQYMMFHETNRVKQKRRSAAMDRSRTEFKTRVVVFDFDGTLTKRDEDLTTWERMWIASGYTIEECTKYFLMFRKGQISHQKWCDITAEHFRNGGFTRAKLEDIAGAIQLVDGVKETIDALSKRGIALYILSGSVKEVIWRALGELRLSFEEVRANELEFDVDGRISRIRGTRFDFEGKAAFIKRIIEDRRCAPLDVLYVGNSCNDVWSSQSGARTLCVNPHFTDPSNQEHWTYFVRKMDNLQQIIKFTEIEGL